MPGGRDPERSRRGEAAHPEQTRGISAGHCWHVSGGAHAPPFASDLKVARGYCGRAQEMRKPIEIRSERTDVFREFCPGRGTLVLLRADRYGGAEDSCVDGRRTV